MQSLSCDKSDTTDKSSIVDAPAVIRDDDKHLEALAYANGAAACFAKPVSEMHLARHPRITAETKTGGCLTRRIDNANDESERFSRPKQHPRRTGAAPARQRGRSRHSITLTTICGTDLHIVRGEYAVKPGLVIGHEPVGIIEELGEGVTGYQIGDRNVVERFARDHDHIRLAKFLLSADY